MKTLPYFKDKVVVITGASSGIGKATAELMAHSGAHVVAAARSLDKLEKMAESIHSSGASGSILPVKADVSSEVDCKNLIDAAVAKHHRIDVLVNNAGISMRAIFKDLDISVIKQLMDINFWGTVYCTKFAMPYLLESKGSVIGVSSIAGYRGLPGRTGYSASKFAMQGFLEALRSENVMTGVHVLIICPGYTASNIRNTALNEAGGQQGESPRDESKMMTSEEVAYRMMRATQKRQKILVLTALGKLTVFLNKWFPGMIDKMVYNTLAKEADSPFK